MENVSTLTKAILIVVDSLNLQIASIEGLDGETKLSIENPIAILRTALTMNLDPRFADNDDYLKIYTNYVLDRDTAECPMVKCISRAVSIFKFQMSELIDWEVFVDQLYTSCVLSSSDEILEDLHSDSPQPINSDDLARSPWAVFCIVLSMSPLTKKVKAK